MSSARRLSGFLLVLASWNAFQWTTLVRNVARSQDRSVGFRRVHYALAAVNLALAGATAVLGWRARPPAP